VVKCIFVVVERERDSTVGGGFFKMVVGAPPDAILILRWPLVVCRLRQETQDAAIWLCCGIVRMRAASACTQALCTGARKALDKSIGWSVILAGW